MLTYSDALAAINALAVLAPRTHRLAIDQAYGRVLAEDVRLAGDQPPFDRATMDGYAVVLAGDQRQFVVVGTVHAGENFSGKVLSGQAVRIMTGAPCPAGTTVVPHELTDRGAAVVAVAEGKLPRPGANIARRGEDGRAGATVVAKGTRLSPLTAAAAAMAGAVTVSVTVAPRLAVVTTGDEVGGASAAGINDSNGPFLAGFAAALGLAAERRHAADEATALKSALTAAATATEVVITTGAVSAGDKDLVPAIAGELGFATVFHHISMQPGKPVFLARRDGPGARFLVGLPGNPVSVVVTAHLVLLPLLARLTGEAPPAWRRLPLAVPWRHQGNRQLFLPARLRGGAVDPIAWNGSGDLLAAAAGDGLVDIAPGRQMAIGEEIAFLPYVGVVAGVAGVIPPRAARPTR